MLGTTTTTDYTRVEEEEESNTQMGNPIIPWALADKRGELIIANPGSTISVQLNSISQSPELCSGNSSQRTTEGMSGDN